ncbi:MAG: ABC transporter permease [Eubacteriales bacterium]|nr:ABC transporter permease [Eubacteriales bacterium]
MINDNVLANIAFQEDDFEFKGADTTKLDTNFASQRFWKDATMRFRNNKGAMFSLVTILLVILLAIFGPIVSPYTYQQQNIKDTNLAPRIPLLENLGIFNGNETLKTSTGAKLKNGYVINKETGEKSDTYYWFGSDTLGRDIWTRTWTGTRVSLYIAVVAVLIDMLIGLSYGLVSGYFGGKVDSVLQRFAEIINSIPTLVIVTLLMLILKPGLATITLALMITGWIGMSRIARAQMLKLKEQEFVLASHTLGASSFRVIFSEILPNIIGQLITNTMFSIPSAIFTEAFLSFVGLGIPEPMCSLGSLISYAFKSFTTHPYQIVPPVIVLALLMLCFNMLADGLRDALDPKMKER